MMRRLLLALALTKSLLPLVRSSWTAARPTVRLSSLETRTIQQASSSSSIQMILDVVPRGGSTSSDADEERYSRQVYTLGARAHGLIRSTTVYLDGPPASGLMFEVAKNLALSGVRHVVIVVSKEDDNAYHDPQLDDLGTAYLRAARAEVGDEENSKSDDQLLMEFVQRLNPSVTVTTVHRDELDSFKDHSVFIAMDRSHSRQLQLNRKCRARGAPFVAVETAGLYGRLFNDFGPDFVVYDADGETPLTVPLDRIVLEEDGKVVVNSVQGEKHDVSRGDRVQFLLRDGSPMETSCTVEKVRNPFSFTVTFDGEAAVNGELLKDINQNAASFRRNKVPQTISFEDLETAISKGKTDGSLFTPCDLEKSFDYVRRCASTSCFLALGLFCEQNGRLPTAADHEDFVALVKQAWVLDGEEKEWLPHCKNFLHTCAAKFSPLQAIFGAIAAQEALKAATGMYQPSHQFLSYDCDEIETGDNGKVCTEDENRDSKGLRHILGNEIVDKLQSQRVFVVGAGAIGCELLKNLASMGVGAGKKGKIFLTDMDTIEKSNLSRQLLFRDSDIGKFKSAAAMEAAMRFNPSLKIESHAKKVGGSEPGPFDDDFWSKKVDIVLNALDNVEARLFMDGQCVANLKALVDAGTLGPKGNVQVVVPHQSESYASSVDPPEPSIPVCTLKNFPYLISHTIQWGRDLFDGLFERRPSQANELSSMFESVSASKIAKSLLESKGEESALEVAQELAEDLGMSVQVDINDSQAVRRACLEWASRLAFEFFFVSTVKLLAKHPNDCLDEDGEPFWSGTRRAPTPLKYVDPSTSLEPQQEQINDMLVQFVKSASRLRAETFLDSPSLFSDEDAIEALKSVYGVVKEPVCKESDDGDVQMRVSLFLENLSPLTKQLSVVEFEKDDDSNDHVSFVNAASNLRAIAYGIPPVDAMETRRVAGNIVPAMVTTTAFVSALSAVELIKLVQVAPLRKHRNAFINLALPFFAFTAPLPADEIPGPGGKTFTLWDRLIVKEGKKAASKGGITMKSFLRKVSKMVADDPGSVEIASVSCGPFMLYANFLHEDDTTLLDSTVWSLVEEAANTEDDFDAENTREADKGDSTAPVDCSKFVDLVVVVEDVESGEELELPPIRVQRYSKK